MHIVTDRVHPDEPCYGLYEGPRAVAGKLRWLQQLFVVRGDAIAKYETDLGPAEQFARVQPLLMPSQGENSVAQLREHAEKNRHDDYWARRAEEMLAESTLVQDHLDQLERDRLEMRNRSVSGPAVTVQRFRYSQDRTRRRIKELTHGD